MTAALGRLRLPRWRLAGAGLIGLVAVGAIWADTRSAGPQYRVATARVGTVTQTVGTSGTVTPVQTANLDFTVAGQVAAVNVQTGERVAKGTVLASLDRTILQLQVAQAQAQLASAQAQLSGALNPSPQQLANAQGAVTSASEALQAAQQSLANTVQLDQQQQAMAQQAVQAAQAALRAAEQQAASACQGAGSTTSTCTADRQTVSQDQAAASAAASSLTLTEVKGRQAQDQATAQVQQATTQLSGAQTALSIVEAGAPAAQVAADRASVVVAQAQLAAARMALGAGRLISPIAGVVAAVGIMPGQSVGGGGGAAAKATAAAGGSVTPNSAGADITVVGTGAYEVQTSVSDTQIGQVKLGDQVVVTPAGLTRPVYGTVSQIGLIAIQGQAVATYPVTVAVTGHPAGLFAGASASVSIVVLDRAAVLTIPTSALHTRGPRTTVLELIDGKAVPHRVTVGATSPTVTEITSGLRAGTQVVVANLQAKLPAGLGSGGRRKLGGGLAGGALARGGHTKRAA
ncbi:MAG TPA: biotin/lipoyl-binding protein [Candidatus Dormibacteraeota bacterium]|nr:biotin/lipoyl-binding protein [Candidatus Dormibacteraeota bacterium]